MHGARNASISLTVSSNQYGGSSVLPNPKPHECGTCGSSFRSSSDLTRHLKVCYKSKGLAPEGLAPEGLAQFLYSCQCGHANDRKDNYKRHIKTCKTSHSGVYGCICRQTFNSKDQMLDHMRLCCSRSNPLRRPRRHRFPTENSSTIYDRAEK